MIKKRILILLLGLLLSSFLPHTVQASEEIRAVGAVTTGGGSLNVRSSASTTATIVSILPRGSYVTLLGKTGSWWRVEYGNGKFGYCHKDYITPVEGTAVTVRTGGNVLNVRSGPGTGYNRVATLPSGSVVLERSRENGWSKVLYHGVKLGYVSNTYLESSQLQVPGSVSLAVPSFKQTDPRWAGVTIGTSGKTIGQIGCATTGIAMMESYRTNSVIHPDEMSRQLQYSSSGNVYWPAHYQVTTEKTGYLGRILESLQKGKPVLIGAKTSAGRQHWVVITGYTGAGLVPESFTIHDPGSNSRKDLQQFLNAFPLFYKYFTY